MSLRPEGAFDELVVAGTGNPKASAGVHSAVLKVHWGDNFRHAVTKGSQQSGIVLTLTFMMVLAKAEAPPWTVDK
jgi:hypothetical protein